VKKRIIQISFLVVVIAFFGWLFFYLSGQKFSSVSLPEIGDIVPIQIGQAPQTPAQINKNGVESATSTADVLFPEDAPLIKISNGEIFDYSVLPNGEIYYLSTDGRVFQAKQGGDEVVSEQKLDSLNKFQRTNDGKRGLVSFGNPQNPEWSVYDFSDKSWRPLPKNIKNLAWGQNNDTLVGVSEENGKRSLIQINLAKNTPQVTTLTTNFNFYDISFIYATKDLIFFIEKPSAYYQGGLYSYGIKNKDVRLVFEKGFGLIVRIFNDIVGGMKFISPNSVTLITTKGESKKDIILQTLPEKCAPSSGLLYCFAAAQMPEKTILPDDYYKNKFNSIDYLYQIDPKTGDQKVTWQSGVGDAPVIDGANILPLEKYIYFVNRYDRALYRLNMDVIASQNKNE
jgi:hypothetical protein